MKTADVKDGREVWHHREKPLWVPELGGSAWGCTVGLFLTIFLFFYFLVCVCSSAQRNIVMGIFRLIKQFWLRTFSISCQTLLLREIKYCPISNDTSPNWWLLCVTTVLHMNRRAPDYRLLWMQETTGWNSFTILILTVIPNAFNPVLCSFALLEFSVVFVHTRRKKEQKQESGWSFEQPIQLGIQIWPVWSGLLALIQL